MEIDVESLAFSVPAWLKGLRGYSIWRGAHTALGKGSGYHADGGPQKQRVLAFRALIGKKAKSEPFSYLFLVTRTSTKSFWDVHHAGGSTPLIAS